MDAALMPARVIPTAMQRQRIPSLERGYTEIVAIIEEAEAHRRGTAIRRQ
jgi:hypothetical protein